MNSIGYMEEAEKDLLHTYNRYGVVLEAGKGVYLFDVEGKKYLDFAAGIAVCALGYGNEEYNLALKEQVDKLLHTSNLYYNPPIIKAAELVKKASGMDRVFFTNSGTEAIEGAIKAAKKYAYTRDGHAGHEIIAMQHSFHGRSLGALSVTGNKHYQEPFEQLLEGIRVAEKSLVPGDHGTTYGGNPFVGAAVSKVLEIMERDQITEHVKEAAAYLSKRLDELKEKHNCVVDHRGMGLMQGLQISIPVGEVSKKALEKGLILITAGSDVLRFVPPLVIENEHVDEMYEILDAVLTEME